MSTKKYDLITNKYNQQNIRFEYNLSDYSCNKKNNYTKEIIGLVILGPLIFLPLFLLMPWYINAIIIGGGIFVIIGGIIYYQKKKK